MGEKKKVRHIDVDTGPDTQQVSCRDPYLIFGGGRRYLNKEYLLTTRRSNVRKEIFTRGPQLTTSPVRQESFPLSEPSAYYRTRQLRDDIHTDLRPSFALKRFSAKR